MMVDEVDRRGTLGGEGREQIRILFRMGVMRRGSECCSAEGGVLRGGRAQEGDGRAAGGERTIAAQHFGLRLIAPAGREEARLLSLATH